MKDIVLFGVQWAWKGTQASMLLDEYSEYLSYFEAWNILRALKSKPNCLGDYVKSKIDKWELVSDEFISSLYSAFLSVLNEENKYALVDWFPRKQLQMNYFLENMKTYQRDYIAVFLDLDKNKAIERLSSRRVCDDCGTVLSAQIDDITKCKNCESSNIKQREDDYPEAIEKRINLYFEETQPVISYFQQQGKLYNVDASWDPSQINKQVKDIINTVS